MFKASFGSYFRRRLHKANRKSGIGFHVLLAFGETLYSVSGKSEREVVARNPHNNVWESQLEFTREWMVLVNQKVARSHGSQLIAGCSTSKQFLHFLFLYYHFIPTKPLNYFS